MDGLKTKQTTNKLTTFHSSAFKWTTKNGPFNNTAFNIISPTQSVKVTTKNEINLQEKH